MRMVRLAVAKTSEILPDSGKIVSLGAEGECAIFYHNRSYFAVGSLCPHQNASLAEATSENMTVTCRRHGYRFDLKTGDCLTVGGYGIPVYKVDVDMETVYVSYWEFD